MIEPKCTILALKGPIEIGTNNIIQEHAIILNLSPNTMTIGDCNLFRVGCRKPSVHLGATANGGVSTRAKLFIQCN